MLCNLGFRDGNSSIAAIQILAHLLDCQGPFLLRQFSSKAVSDIPQGLCRLNLTITIDINATEKLGQAIVTGLCSLKANSMLAVYRKYQPESCARPAHAFNPGLTASHEVRVGMRRPGSPSTSSWTQEESPCNGLALALV